jgi:Ca2+-binding RTX toxin-like protein
MAKLIVGSRPFDMTAWDLSDIATGTVTASSATEVDVTGSGGRFVYQIIGTGFTTFDTNGFPTDGTVTGLVEDVPTKTPLTISGISISASDFMGFVNSNDATGLETAIFSGNDSFLGKAGDDVLLGFAGNDIFNLTKGGNDTANGGDGNDTFNFGATFTAADSVDGGTGTDKVTLGGDYSAGVTFGAATMVNVEMLVLAAGNNYNLTLNATTNTTGQSLNITASTLTAANTITIDGSATSGSLRIVGGDGNDTLTGGTGTNTLQGGNGNDTYFAGTGINLISDTKGSNTYIFSNWNSSDVIKGASGDHLVFDGDFSGGATINAAQVQGGFHSLAFDAGHSYNITLGSGAPINTFDASALASGQNLTLNASAVSGPLTFFGGNGNDVLTGNNGSDFFLMGPSNGASDQGNDIVTGGTGNDTFNFTTAFTAADSVNGVSGNDVLEMRVLGSTVSIDLTATSIQNIASLEISEFATNFTMTENDANVAAGKTMSVELDQVAQNSVIAFNGSAETDGSFSFILTSGFPSYIVSGGAQNDVFRVSDFTTTSRFDGGGGYNVMDVASSTNFTFGTHAITNIQEIDVIGQGTVTTVDSNVGAGQTLIVKTGADGGGFNGLKETDGNFQITGFGAAYGGQGNDTIALAGGHAHFQGGGGADHLTNTASLAEFIYQAASDSTDANYDTITGFESNDTFKLWYSVTGVDAAVTTGALSTATFDADLAAAIGSSQLAVHHAVIFTPDSGTLAGDHFLVVDANGVAGYQAGQDLVIELTSSSSTIATFNFTT